MIIVNDKENVAIVFGENAYKSINIHTDGKRIMANDERNCPPAILGAYESQQKAERAFSHLIKAIEDEKTVYYMEKDANIKVGLYRGGGRNLYDKTNGKSK